MSEINLPDEAVEAMSQARYERYDSHFSMPGGLTWEQYSADDPTGADALYRVEARIDLTAALPALREGIAAEVLGPVRALAEEYERDRDVCVEWLHDPTKIADDGHPARLSLMAETLNGIATRLRAIEAALSAPVQAAEPTCPTPGCDGDIRYSAPGRGHLDDCRWPSQAAEEVGGDHTTQPVDVERIRAAIRLVQPDHLTPVGARIIEQALGGGSDE